MFSDKLIRGAALGTIVLGMLAQSLPSMAQTNYTLEELTLSIRESCPVRWEAPESEISFTSGDEVWLADLVDKVDFVKYAVNNLRQAPDGTFVIPSFSDPATIIRYCGAWRLDFYDQMKFETQNFVDALIANNGTDADADGVIDELDICDNSVLANGPVNVQGCTPDQIDNDNDGVHDSIDSCLNTNAGESVDANGCAVTDIDSDGDGIKDYLDAYPHQSATQCTP